MLSALRRGYQAVLPYSVRAKLWRLRRLRRFNGRCNVCRGNNVVRYKNPVVDYLPFGFYRCRDCNFIFVYPLPDIMSSAYYEAGTLPDFGEGEAVWNGHYLDSIGKYANAGGKLLEIAFGNASFLRLAHQRGWEVYGTELSVPRVEHARAVLKLPNISLGTIEEVGYPEKFFDVVAGFNFLEHVPDPRKTLEGIMRVLRPSGVLALMCPNISGIYHSLMPEILADNDPLKISWCPPEHISYFNKSNLRMLLEDVGLTVICDESHLMSSLWRQFEVSIGPKPTDEKLGRLVARIGASASPKGDAKVTEFRDEIKRLLAERMTWTMLSDLSKLEPMLGAEPGILMLGRKLGA